MYYNPSTASLLFIIRVIAVLINRAFRYASRIPRLRASSDTIIPGFIFGVSHHECVSTITSTAILGRAFEREIYARVFVTSPAWWGDRGTRT